MAIAEQDILRLRALISAALQAGTGIPAIIAKMQDALSGVYHARQYTDHEKHIALLGLCLGGRTTAYVLNHSAGLPSIQTLYAEQQFTIIKPMLGRINWSDIAHNIQHVLIPGQEDAKLLINEIAINEAPVFFSCENCVGGLCWKHGLRIDTKLTTFDNAIAIRNTIDDGTVHLGKKMTVAAVVSIGEDGLYLILTAASCKEKDTEDSVYIFQMTINEITAQANQPNSKVGHLSSIATDGASIRRAAGYHLLVRYLLTLGSSLDIILSQLPGFNCFTGPNGITLDFDYKHILKWICTLLRQKAGITLAQGCIINPMFLCKYLLQLPSETVESVNGYLYPDDPQNVPKAINTLKAIVALCQLDTSEFSPSKLADHESLQLLGYILETILLPFTSISTSLSEQLKHLFCHTHLIFALFRTYRLDFMSNQLYGDIQTMVKKAVFTVAKAQVEDPKQEITLSRDIRDNDLEEEFGFYRMDGGHNSGMNFKEGTDHMGHACDIAGAFSCQPDLNPGLRRLKMDCTCHLDHLTRESFGKSDFVVGHCHIASMYTEATLWAKEILTRVGKLPAGAYDFNSIFSDTSIDLMHIFGQGRYPGIEDLNEVDCSLIISYDHPPMTSPTPANHSAVSTTDPTSIIAGTSSATPVTNVPDFSNVEDDLSEQLEDFLEDTELSLKLPSGPGIRPDDFLFVPDAGWKHKASICCLYISPNTGSIDKSHELLK
ncbi:hypothetical protein BT96DRAFT_836102 [Gymnopus androsaceus JB14]|uniref:Uncharacterized protein n=1 Tax=Gymnopus androsaceus JB14 TaxID=1447944 RepID=A0A6A4GRZ2_9AGAR|nr:hypothetical protein BT96DRAFT_836102 [Gymnopus androsaceus JB14]